MGMEWVKGMKIQDGDFHQRYRNYKRKQNGYSTTERCSEIKKSRNGVLPLVKLIQSHKRLLHSPKPKQEK